MPHKVHGADGELVFGQGQEHTVTAKNVINEFSIRASHRLLRDVFRAARAEQARQLAGDRLNNGLELLPDLSSNKWTLQRK